MDHLNDTKYPSKSSVIGSRLQVTDVLIPKNYFLIHFLKYAKENNKEILLNIEETFFDYMDHILEKAIAEHFVWSNPEQINLIEEDIYHDFIDKLLLNHGIILELYDRDNLVKALVSLTSLVRTTIMEIFGECSEYEVWFKVLDHKSNIRFEYEDDYRIMEWEAGRGKPTAKKPEDKDQTL